jgi:hypothetical protein
MVSCISGVSRIRRPFEAFGFLRAGLRAFVDIGFLRAGLAPLVADTFFGLGERPLVFARVVAAGFGAELVVRGFATARRLVLAERSP